MRFIKHNRVLAWIPAASVLGLSLLTVAGISLIPAAGATHSGGVNDHADVTITAEVSPQIDITPNCAAAASTTIPALTSGGGALTTTGDCSMDYSTNNATGAHLNVLDNRVDTLPAFCKVGDCATTASQFNDQGIAGAALADGSFGATLMSVAGSAANVWTVNNSTPSIAGASAWYALAEAAGVGTRACNAPASTSSAICNFRFGADSKAVQNSGSYNALVRFQVTNNA